MVDSQNITILYVDDEEANLFLFKVNFETKYSVYTAESGPKGLEELDLHGDEIIVVISDMRMPDMNGIEFIRKAREKYDNILYFILTGFDYNDEIDQALQEKVIHKFFTKPFDMAEIESSIKEALDTL